MRYFRSLFFMVVGLLAIAATPGLALAAEGGDGGSTAGMIALAAGLAVGLPTIGAALGQGRATAAAMESIGRNPVEVELLPGCAVHRTHERTGELGAVTLETPDALEGALP